MIPIIVQLPVMFSCDEAYFKVLCFRKIEIGVPLEKQDSKTCFPLQL